MQVYRCLICGDPYLGREKPTNCSSCAVPIEYLALARDWRDKEEKNLSTGSRKNLERALELELKNNTFYTACSRKSKNPELKAMFWAMAKIAAEHAKIVNKILKKAAPRYVEDSKACTPDEEKCASSDKENVKEIGLREESAVKFYNQAAGEAREERVKEIFEALGKVKSEFIKLSEIN